MREQGGNPVPTIIDFGIAKATARKLSDGALTTELGVAVGTPVYRSPEQAEASGLDIDTRADIYNLGIVLYQLVRTASSVRVEHGADRNRPRHRCASDTPQCSRRHRERQQSP